jgi:hypothetical protein
MTVALPGRFTAVFAGIGVGTWIAMAATNGRVSGAFLVATILAGGATGLCGLVEFLVRVRSGRFGIRLIVLPAIAILVGLCALLAYRGFGAAIAGN